MSDKKDQTIGIRFSKKEREYIEIYAKNRNNTITEFIRKAVFYYMNELKNNVGILNPYELRTNLEIIQKSAEEIISNIHSLNKKFGIDDSKHLDDIPSVSSKLDKDLQKILNI